jgi:outer membrane protein OmpA-like peptidoglycan-associated protein
MKKFILMMALMFSVVMGANAQTALETQKLFDNTSIGVVVGATTPLDFNSVFPLNTVAGLKLGKDFTPVFGVEAEGLAILNDNHFADIKTVVKATNVGLNGVTNLSNLFGDYTGAPRAFEVKTVAGLGWLYLWNTNVHDLTAKTGLDLAFNFGEKKATSLVFTPAVYWNLTKTDKIQFNKNHAQLGLTASLVYHFKTSNGTNNFKLYDVGAMNAEINNLRAELAKKPTEIIRDHFVEKVVEKNVGNNEWVVFFAKNSAELTAEAKKALDKIPAGSTVDITATASPEGTEERNNALSEDRAEVVAKYLDARGLKIGSVKGLGVQGEASNRVAIVVTK